MLDPCPCTGPGHCPHFQRELSPADYALGQRRDELGQARRRQWAREAGLAVDPEPEQPKGCAGCGTRGGAAPTVPVRNVATAEVIANRDRTPREYPRAAPVPTHPVVVATKTAMPAAGKNIVLTATGRGPEKIRLVNKLAFGDCVVMSAALESLHQQFPNRYLTDVDVAVPAVFEGNPHVTRFPPGEPGVRTIAMNYDRAIGECNSRPSHFLSGYVRCLADELGIPLELQVNRPCLYLTEEEKGWMNQVEEIAKKPTKFWLLNCGAKNCFPNKQHLPEVYREVVDHFFAKGITFVQIGRAEHNGTVLKRVIDLVGKTDDRQLIRLAYHCQGGVGPSTALQHLCAAFEKCYTLADSVREPAHWWGYANQLSLVRHGCLPCATKGCWKTHVLPAEGKAACDHPVFGGSLPITRCMSLITSRMIIDAIESFYEGGRLSR